jgi:hypothetical protein
VKQLRAIGVEVLDRDGPFVPTRQRLLRPCHGPPGHCITVRAGYAFAGRLIRVQDVEPA